MTTPQTSQFPGTTTISAAGTVLMDGHALATVQYGFADVSNSGANLVISAQPNQSIVVLSLLIISSLAQSISFNSDATQISATFPLAQNGGFALPFSEHGWFATAPGEALNITLSAATPTGVQIVWAAR